MMAALTEENAPSPLKRKAEDEEETGDGRSAGSDQPKKYKPIIMERKADGTPLKKRLKKSVSFDGVKVYFFPRSQGFTSVPSQGGATLGMSPKHDAFQHYSLGEFAKLQDLSHRNAIKVQLLQRRREQLLRNNLEHHEGSLEADVDEEISQISVGDYYFLQPVPTKQRRALLRGAGVRKIDRAEKAELKRIRVSRESCGCDCAGYCDPRTCACSLAGIKCQVDRMSFPCGCTRDYCRNANGRIEFNPLKVREHFVATMRKLEWGEDCGGGSSSENGGSSPESGSPSPEREGGQFAGQASPELSLATTSSSSFESSSHGSFSSGSYVFNNLPLINSKTFHNEEFHHSHSIGHYQPFPPSSSLSSSSLHPLPSGYSGGSGVSSEGSVPIRVESCQSLNFGPQKLHFNDLEADDLADRNFILGLPSTPSYDSSEDSLSSSSEASSTSGGENSLSRDADPYYFGDSADFGKPSGNEANMGFPHFTGEGGSESLSNSKESPEQSGKTYTELTQSSTLQSFGFPQFPNMSSQSVVEGQGLPPMGSIFQSLAKSRQHDPSPIVTLGMLSDIGSTLAGGQGARLYSTYSTPTTAVNSLEEMNETAIATSSISTPSVTGYQALGHTSEMRGSEHSSGASGEKDNSPNISQDTFAPLQDEEEDSPGSEGAKKLGTGNESRHSDVKRSSEDIPSGALEGVESPDGGSNGEEGDKEWLDGDGAEEEVTKLVREDEEERDSSDSSSDSAVFSGAEEPCAAGELDEGVSHPMSSDSSNDSGVAVTGKESQSEGVVSDFVDSSTEIKIPRMFTPLNASSLPILTTAAAE